MKAFFQELRENLGRSRFEDLLSTTGILIVLGIVLLINLLFQVIPGRFDFTEFRIFTLSKGTREIVRELDSPVKIKYYATDGRDMMSAEERQFSKGVEDRLLEYKKIGGKNILFERYNPEPDTDDEDAAILDGLEPIRGQEGEIYMGIVVEFIDAKEVIPFIDPQREQLLEYDITNAIVRVYRDRKPKLTIMTSLNVAGGFAGGNFQAGPRPPWFFYTQLEKDYDVELIPPTTESIDADETDVLLVLHPYDITETGEYAIDQYLLSGGTVFALVDPLFYAARALTPPANPMMGGGPQGPAPSSDLPTLFEKYGIEYVSSQVLADANYQTEIERGRFLPTLLSLNGEAMTSESVVTSQLTDVYLPFPGGMKVEPPKGIDPEILIKSSKNSDLVSSFQAEPEALDQLVREFRASGEEKAIAVRLTGRFESVFPGGNPNAPTSPPKETGGEGEDGEAAETAAGEDGAVEDEGGNANASEGGHLANAVAEGTLVVMSDLDFLYDQFSVRVMNFGGMRAAQMLNQNLSLFQNTLEVLAGDPRLVDMRSRASTRRPFTLLNRMQERARAKMMDTIENLEQKEREVQEQLNNALRIQESEDGSQLILDQSAIDQNSIEELRRQRVEATRDLRDARKELRRRQEGFINLIKFLNITIMPLVVIVVGLILYLKRQRRVAAH